jgi:hypothetical protein
MSLFTILHGRIGNLLFELAAGLKVAKDNNADCKFYPKKTDQYRNYKEYIESNNLLETIFRKLKDNYISIELDASRDYNKKETGVYKYGFKGEHSIYKEIPYTENMILFGHFQNEKYFYKKQVFEYFGIYDEIKEEIRNLYGDLSNYIGINIRRGDFIKNTGCTVLSYDYYIDCMNMFPEDSKFIITSDDIEWCKEVFNNKNSIIFANKQANNKILIDLYINTLCEHNIISCSTFSWWGAYLNPNINKKVIVPSSWLKEYPENWIVNNIKK